MTGASESLPLTSYQAYSHRWVRSLPWHFVVVSDPAFKHRVRAETHVNSQNS